MSAPFQSTPPQVIKIEDEGNGGSSSQGLSEQELMDMFRKGLQRRLELRKKQGSGMQPLVPARPPASKPPHPASKKPTVACGVCGVLSMTPWHLKDHERGRKHRNKVACLAGQMSVQCQVCNVYLSGALNVEHHCAGKQQPGGSVEEPELIFTSETRIASSFFCEESGDDT